MTLSNLFNKPTDKTIGDISFRVHQVAYEQFEDALAVGAWMESVDMKAFNAATLQKIAKGSPERLALDRVIAGCLALPGDGVAVDELPRLKPDDLGAMPIVMVAEAFAVVLEVNSDFFFHALKRVAPIAMRLGMSIGSAFPSNSSGPATTPTPSDATPSASSAAS